ncbi:POU domain, class 3, transcription factor 3-like [Melanaphis sacchari]|uniref:POU domain, class 3, transcription factor 3-like n=1 Tax=Melanaphis sacchari TaxID=742174 RepID=UPI000DC12E0A|nr:POU domain, class 3, transcription factor 3-like [Melanaphis sacchari]
MIIIALCRWVFTVFVPCVSAHEELKFLDMITEKSEANAAAAMPSTESKTVLGVVANHQQQVHLGRQSVNRPPASVLIGHHHHHHHHQPPVPPPLPPPPSHHHPVQQLNQQPPLHHTRSGSSLSDYRGAVEPSTVQPIISLEPGGGGGGGGGSGRRAAVNGSVPGVMCGGGPAVWHPRPIYPFPLPLPSPGTLWHHAQPHFSTPGFPPTFIENEWSRHCRLPMFNPELQPEPVNLQNNNHHHRRPEPGRALEIAGRLQQDRVAHNRPAAPVNPPAQDDREQTRHHA